MGRQKRSESLNTKCCTVNRLLFCSMFELLILNIIQHVVCFALCHVRGTLDLSEFEQNGNFSNGIVGNVNVSNVNGSNGHFSNSNSYY